MVQKGTVRHHTKFRVALSKRWWAVVI